MRVLLSFLTLFFFSVVAFAGPPKSGEGDILRIFEGQRVYVITNEEPELANSLLDGCHVRQKCILTPEEWAEMPESIRALVTRVYLINREKLPFGTMLPAKCPADNDELYTQVVRNEFRSSTTYEAIISAPDEFYLRQAAMSFRRLASLPRTPIKLSVPSLAIVPVGIEAERIARQSFLKSDSARFRAAHILRPQEYARVQPRLYASDELILIDRSVGTAATSLTLTGLTSDHPINATETVAWRIRKQDGKIRAVISAPNAAQLTSAAKGIGVLTDLPEEPTILANARDLRSVRRIAVAGIKMGKSTELARQLAARAASDIRALDAFEVVEREGLSQILGEIALGQAGITKAGDRVKVRQLAAADALLLVDITGIEARTNYSAAHKRLSPAIPPPPARPNEPSRLKNTFGITNQGILKVVEAVFSRNIGTKNEDDYRDECDRYRNETLPQWQRQMEAYQQERRNRPVNWEQKIAARSGVHVTGSLRLVDLSDGLVLWESPFAASDTEEKLFRTDTLTINGEDSRPGALAIPESTNAVPDELLSRVAVTALQAGVSSLRSTALLPCNLPVTTVSAATSSSGSTATSASSISVETPPTASGKVLDVDNDTLLIGLGGGDGLKVGDILIISLEDKSKVQVSVTKIRPRTCDAIFAVSVSSRQRAQVATGQMVTRR
jgi:hypothetical protein